MLAAHLTWRTVTSVASEVRAGFVEVPLELDTGRIDRPPNVFHEAAGGPEHLVINLLAGEKGRLSRAGLLLPATSQEEARYVEMHSVSRAKAPRPRA